MLIRGSICFMNMYMAASLMDECMFNGNVYGFLDECMLDGHACSVDGCMQSGCACLISPLQKYSIGLPWNIHVSVSMELHGGSMVSTIENPWVYPEFFMVNTMEFP